MWWGQFLFLDIQDYKKKGWFQSPSTTLNYFLSDSYIIS